MGKSRNCKTNCKMYCQPSLNETFSFKIKFTLLTDPSWVFPLHCNTSSHCQGPLIWQQFSTLPADTQSSTPLLVLCFLELWELWPNNRCTQPGTIDRGFYLFIHTFFQIVSTARICFTSPFSSCIAEKQVQWTFMVVILARKLAFLCDTEQTENMCVTDGLHTAPIAASFLRSTSCLRLYFLFDREASVAETDVLVMRMVCKTPGVRGRSSGINKLHTPEIIKHGDTTKSLSVFNSSLSC